MLPKETLNGGFTAYENKQIVIEHDKSSAGSVLKLS
jgi:hypothetical protein